MGYLGMVGGLDPCAAPPEYTPNVQQVIAFMNSPYGIAHNFGSGGGAYTFTPYLIDPVTLDYEIRPDLAITGPSPPAVVPFIVLNDTTMIITRDTPMGGFPTNFQHELFVLSRSGINIGISGSQHSVLGRLSEIITPIDTTHFVRAYTSPVTPFDRIVETFSVSGSTISLVASDTLTAITAIRDPDGLISTLSTEVFPFHYDSSTGIIYMFGETSGVGGGSRAIIRTPFSTGGGLSTPLTTANTRFIGASGIQAALIEAGKPGTSEVVLFTTVGDRKTFYDDGSNMHIGSLNHIMGQILYPNSSDETPHGNYLTTAAQMPSGSTTTGPGIVTQSNGTLSFSPISPVFRCLYIGGVNYGNAIGGTRHGPGNVGVVIGGSDISGLNSFLRVYRW